MHRSIRACHWGLLTLLCLGCGSDPEPSNSNANIGGSAQGGNTNTAKATGGTAPVSGGSGAQNGGSSAMLSGGSAALVGGSAAVTGGSAALVGGSAAVTGGSAALVGGSAALTGGAPTAFGGTANTTGGIPSSGGTVASGGAVQSGGSSSSSGGGENTGGTLAIGAGGTGGTNDSQIGGASSVGGSAPTGGSGNPATGGTGGSDPNTSTGGTSAPGTTGPVSIVLTVNTTANVHDISRLIYGVNPGKVDCSNPIARFTLCRLGGNPWSTYNWENNASNAGKDDCFQNDAALGTSDVPADTVTSLIASANAQAATATFTIPIIDYVAADKLGGSLVTCSGDVNQSPDYLNTRFKRNQARKGAAFADPPDLTDAYVYQDEFLQYTKNRANDADVIVTLDNQPELWSYTHERVHPDHATYLEVVERNVTYASMVRDNWPSAEITGYGGYGDYGFLTLQDAPNPPGNMEFLDYYLSAMSEAEVTAGRRLIDYLDIHWYSNVSVGEVGVLSTDTSAPVAAARSQAPRSLWDPSYVEPSWIGDATGKPIQLIPWIKSKITSRYPNTKLAISEWAYGAENSISGAIAVADALGIFGREGVGMAAAYPMADDESFLIAAFAMFRNYDGAGASFGDLSVSAASNDVSRVSVYASKDLTDPNHVVIVAINRSEVEQAVTLNVEGANAFGSAQVYQLTAASAAPIAVGPLTALTSNVFAPTLPPYSITVFVPKV